MNKRRLYRIILSVLMAYPLIAFATWIASTWPSADAVWSDRAIYRCYLVLWIQIFIATLLNAIDAFDPIQTT